MRTLQRRLVRLVAAAVAVVGWGGVIVAPTGASAAIVTTPVGLCLGDQYRLAFVTSTTRDATSSPLIVGPDAAYPGPTLPKRAQGIDNTGLRYRAMFFLALVRLLRN